MPSSFPKLAALRERIAYDFAAGKNLDQIFDDLEDSAQRREHMRSDASGRSKRSRKFPMMISASG